MNREQRRAMQLAGTVSVPQKFPQLAMISFVVNVTDAGDADVRFEYLAVDHVINAKLRIRRSFRTSDISAIFLPKRSDDVDLQEGEWYLGGEITKSLPAILDNHGGTARGIVYVPEQAATLMEVEVGMTAAESVDYYPPLPDDRSVDHYEMGGPGQKGGRHTPSSAPCAAFFAEDPCSATFAEEPCSNTAGDPRKPKKEKEKKKGKKKSQRKKQEKKPAKKDGKSKGGKKTSKKQPAALDPRSSLTW